MKNNPNYTYGVDTNDHEAIKRAYKKYRKKHIIITFISFISIAVLLLFVYDFYNVSVKEGTPIFALKGKVNGGYKYTGIGYKALYCDNGQKYVGFIEGKSCTSDGNISSFKDILYNEFMSYANKNKIINKGALLDLEIINYELDENTKEGNVYAVTIKYLCNDNSKTCLKTDIEYNDQNNVKLFIGVDKYNKVYSVETFRQSGSSYEALKKEYQEKVKQYLLKSYMADEEKLKYLSIDINNYYGQYKYNSVTYANSYFITINYLCNDSSNKCVEYPARSEDNLSFTMSMLLDSNNNIALMTSTNIFNI